MDDQRDVKRVSAEAAELSEAGPEAGPGAALPDAVLPGAALPVMPGFREMALRRMADEQAAQMAQDRARLVRELAEQRQAAGLSQTEIAARMVPPSPPWPGWNQVPRTSVPPPWNATPPPSAARSPGNSTVRGRSQRMTVRAHIPGSPFPPGDPRGPGDPGTPLTPGRPPARRRCRIRSRRPGCGSTRTPTGRGGCTSGCSPSGSCWRPASSTTTRPPGSRPSCSPWTPRY